MNAKLLSSIYGDALQRHLADGGEASLHRGYTLARRALVHGAGILELADAHHVALQNLVEVHSPLRRKIGQAGAFFDECLSPFEMSHRAAQDGLRALRRVNELLESEHRRIAHALHDEAGQLLASVHLAVADLAGELPDRGGCRVQNIHRLLEQIEQELRSLSHELRPTVLDNLGLWPAVEVLVEKVAKRTGLAVSLLGAIGERLPPEVETTLYRVVQEGLNNVVKHADARSAQVELRRDELGISCSIRDDGRGFAAEVQDGLGLAGMRERLKAVGGSLHLKSRPGQGTTVRASVPLRGGLHDAVPRVAGR